MALRNMQKKIGGISDDIVDRLARRLETVLWLRTIGSTRWYQAITNSAVSY